MQVDVDGGPLDTEISELGEVRAFLLCFAKSSRTCVRFRAKLGPKLRFPLGHFNFSDESERAVGPHKQWWSTCRGRLLVGVREQHGAVNEDQETLGRSTFFRGEI